MVGIPPELVDLIEQSLVKFSKDPQAQSRPTAPMLTWEGPIYHDRFNFENRRHTLTAFFFYGPAENEITITDLTLMPPYPVESDVVRVDAMKVREPIMKFRSIHQLKGRSRVRDNIPAWHGAACHGTASQGCPLGALTQRGAFSCAPNYLLSRLSARYRKCAAEPSSTS
jgi:hypothetical protein